MKNTKNPPGGVFFPAYRSSAAPSPASPWSEPPLVGLTEISFLSSEAIWPTKFPTGNRRINGSCIYDLPSCIGRADRSEQRSSQGCKTGARPWTFLIYPSRPAPVQSCGNHLNSRKCQQRCGPCCCSTIFMALHPAAADAPRSGPAQPARG